MTANSNAVTQASAWNRDPVDVAPPPGYIAATLAQIFCTQRITAIDALQHDVCVQRLLFTVLRTDL
jgi:hypothetical protein